MSFRAEDVRSREICFVGEPLKIKRPAEETTGRFIQSQILSVDRNFPVHILVACRTVVKEIAETGDDDPE